MSFFSFNFPSHRISSLLQPLSSLRILSFTFLFPRLFQLCRAVLSFYTHLVIPTFLPSPTSFRVRPLLICWSRPKKRKESFFKASNSAAGTSLELFASSSCSHVVFLVLPSILLFFGSGVFHKRPRRISRGLRRLRPFLFHDRFTTSPAAGCFAFACSCSSRPASSSPFERLRIFADVTEVSPIFRLPTAPAGAATTSVSSSSAFG